MFIMITYLDEIDFNIVISLTIIALLAIPNDHGW